MSDMRAAAAKGTAWMFGARQAIRLLGLVSTLVMARLLMPEDFGLIAQSMMAVGLIEALSAFGFELALIQNHEARRSHYDTVWTLNIIKAAVVALLLAGGAAPIARFFEEPRLEAIIYVLAGSFFAGSFSNVGVIDLRKHLRFRADFMYLVVPKIASISANIAFAFYFLNYWALVAGMLTGSAATFTMSYVMSPYRPRFSLAEWRDVFGFSKWVLVSQYLAFLSREAPIFIIGKLVASHQVGLYRMATELSNFLSTEIYIPALRALYPAYAKNKEGAAGLYLDAVGIVILLIGPACMGMVLVAEPMVALLLGEKWMEIVPLVQILTIGALLRAVWLSPGAVAMARGRPRDSAYLAVPPIVVLVPALIWFTLDYGLMGAAWAKMLAAVVQFVMSLVYVYWGLKTTVREIIRPLWRPTMAVIIMVIVTSFVPVSLWRIPVGVVSYVSALLGLWHLSGRPLGPEAVVLRKLGLYKGPAQAPAD